MKKITRILSLSVLLLFGSGCLSRTYYYEPNVETLATGKDGFKRGAIKEEGYYSWFSEAPGKSFLNPSMSIVGKEINGQ